MRINSKIRRDRERGLEVNRGQLWAAYIIEAGIIAACVFAGYQFAERYVSDERQLWLMAIIGTVAVGLAEIARIQLAKATRTQPGFWMKTLAVVGVICMCLVTTKSMSQVMDQVFSPRLKQVQQATDSVETAELDLAAIQAKRGSRDQALKPLQQRVDAANQRIAEINANIQSQGKAPAPRERKKTIKSTCWNKRHTKKWSCNKTVTELIDVPWAGQQFADQLKDAYAERDAAVVARDAAAEGVADDVETVVAKEGLISELKKAHREAVANSQLHSFTAMVFGKNPVEVTDGEIHWFLRFFVFVPAIMISIASTLLAVTAYRPWSPRTQKPASIEIVGAKTLERHIETIVDERMRAQSSSKIVHAPFRKEA